MTEDNLNDEVIKIFIESWLVKDENFTLVQQSLENYSMTTKLFLA
ncbi:hypothetical protein HMP0015_3353 [Acinetobacter haemolyticus ATCC 19194]|uniref:Uncharacterized protein n=1 Tax=Acinetobacter haemolyticus ATCC 19194 TaxID=707232 RepID=D4XUG1_ACIHA|nr:hypothetical protein [Acinetobacter haemolyticus]EFF81154.1 hypothetical protein HMP0015_3353 [Acinetobacter haemolyticus ATCC 19194]